jgi:outer membrane protein
MKCAWLSIILFATLGVAFAQQPARETLSISLKQAVHLALSPEGNAQIEISREALKQAHARSNQARAALLPNADSSLIYRNQTLNMRANGLNFNISPSPGVGFAFPKLVGPFNVMDARISGSQSIFDYSSIRRFQAAHSGTSAAESELANAEEQIAARVARAYLSAIRADADVEAAKANITLSQGVLEQAEDQKKAGAGTGIEITRTKVLLANDRQRLLVAENARHSAHLQLARVIDLPLDSELVLTDKLGYLPVDAMTLEQANKYAITSRPDLKAQQEREESARLSSSATKFERLPSLGLFGDYGSIGSGLDNSIPTRTYGVTLRVPLFDGGRRDARRVEASSIYRVEKIRTDDLKKQIELDLRLALDALHSSEEQVKVARDGLELSENELAQARRRFDSGVAIGLEVTDAQTRMERARENQTQALFNYNLARIDLEQALGRVRNSIQ